jgi:calpain-15
LFDGQLGNRDSNGNPEGKWVYIYIDDHIPCSKQAWNNGEGTVQTLYAQPKGNEVWVLLLEKAFAKLCGSYAALEGGDTAWALRAMTGEKAFAFKKQESHSWQRVNLVSEVNAKDKRASVYYRSGEAEQSKADMFKILTKYIHAGSLVCASGATEIKGLHSGHAYSIISVYEKKGLKLLQVRNPWGSGEWQGDWSDKSPLWEQAEHKAVKKAIYKDEGESAHSLPPFHPTHSRPFTFV